MINENFNCEKSNQLFSKRSVQLLSAPTFSSLSRGLFVNKPKKIMIGGSFIYLFLGILLPLKSWSFEFSG